MAATPTNYIGLIKKFELKPIKNAAHKAKAVAIMKVLALKGTSRTKDETDYLVVLGRLIADYEHTQPGIQKFLAEVEQITPAESLAFLMEENGFTQTQLGIDQGNLSSFLKGKRGLSKASALKLARRFRVKAELFLSAELAAAI